MMRKNKKAVLPSRTLCEKAVHQPRHVIGGYQPLASDFSPTKPPPPPKIGKRSGKK